MPSKVSAGIRLFRKREHGLEVFLAHPGGPFFAKKDEGIWTIPKGEINPEEDPLKAAIREFYEEIGVALDSSKTFTPLGDITQKSGKLVHAWAYEGDIDPTHKVSGGSFNMQWPPRSGKTATFQEIDRAEFFTIDQAKIKLIEAQRPFLERLLVFSRIKT